MQSVVSSQVSVAVQAADPVSQAGIVSSLELCGELQVVPAEQLTEADVVVLAPALLSAAVLSGMRRIAKDAGKPAVLILDNIDESDLLTVIECGVVSILPRGAATSERLTASVRSAASGGGTMPPELLGDLLKHVERMHRELLAPRGLSTSGLTPREIDVLRLAAEGFDTAETARKLSYSERTVKNVIHGVTTRMQLRNRTHAVAYAMRAGMI